MDPLFWAGLLLFIGLLLVGIEFFIPSSGVLGVLAALSICSGIGLAFYERGPAMGFLFIGIAVVSVPAILVGGFKILPHTPIGKILISAAPTSEDVLSDVATRRQLRDCIGWIGRATSVMLPSGSIEVEGHQFDAVSQGMPIEAGTPVKIVDVQGTRIIVRPCGEDEISLVPRRNAPAVVKTAVPDANADELLSQPLESLGIENWEGPLDPPRT
ncbi:MAG: NfeD family protein [Pirellulales bacterium]